MKLTLFGIIAIIGVVTLVVFLGTSQWDRPDEHN
jgi:hypothetical protein